MTKKYAVALLVFASLHPWDESLSLQRDTSQAPLDEQEAPAFDENFLGEPSLQALPEEIDPEHTYAP